MPDGGRIARRGLGSPTLFAIVYTSVASALYFALGVVADNALGLTPVVFLIAGLFFVLAVLTYVEGASLHQERAGSTVFARYAFNELWSFIAAWAILLDFLILVAVCAYMTTDYIGVVFDVFNHGDMSRDFTYVDDIVEGVVRVMERIPQADPGADMATPDPARSTAPYQTLDSSSSITSPRTVAPGTTHALE